MMLLPALVSLPLLTASSPFVKRQSGTSIEDIDAQIRQVRAAAYAAQVIEAGDAIDVCGQAEPETGPPYDAELARTLMYVLRCIFCGYYEPFQRHEDSRW